jgi:3-methylcrotonyl-CoA carboxylase beta subunit
MIVCNDATVKGGTYYPLTVKKHLRAQEIAEANRLPCIYLVDSGGANLPQSGEVFPDRDHFGRIFFNQAQMSAQGHPADRLRHGQLHRGRRLCAGDVDESVIVRNQGTIFLAGPPLVKAATGEEISAEDLGGGDLHGAQIGRGRSSGRERRTCADDRARYRQPPGPRHGQPQWPKEPRPPKYDAEELYGIIPDDVRAPYDVREVIARLVDGSEFHEFKALTAPRWSAALRISGACRSRSSPTTACCSAKARSRARISSSWPASGGSRCCSCRTSPASWSAANMRRRASPSTAPSW